MPFRHAARWAAVVAFAGFAAGCGSAPTGTVSGVVTVGGQPVPNGLITFSSVDGKRDSYSAAVLNGRYTTSPIPVGATQVTVTSRGGNPAEAPAGKEVVGDGVPPPKKAARKDVGVPARYAAAATSGLTYEVTKGESTKDFDLSP